MRYIPFGNHGHTIVIICPFLKDAVRVETDGFIGEVVGDSNLHHVALVDDDGRRRECFVDTNNGTRNAIGGSRHIRKRPIERRRLCVDNKKEDCRDKYGKEGEPLFHLKDRDKTREDKESERIALRRQYFQMAVAEWGMKVWGIRVRRENFQ